MFTLLLLVVLLGILGVQVPRYLRKKSSSPCSFLHHKKKRKSKTSEISAEDCISQKNWHYCLNDPMFGFGRILGKVYLDDLEINQYMLETGGCNKYVPKNTLNHKIK